MPVENRAVSVFRAVVVASLCALALSVSTRLGPGYAVAQDRSTIPTSPIKPSDPRWSIALHYGAQAPLNELQAFDVAVVEADHGYDPQTYRAQSRGLSELYAYLSLGEVHPSRAWFGRIPAHALVGTNAQWGSKRLDPSWPGYAEFVAQTMVAPLWARGYRGFFLDTLDAYHALGAQGEKLEQQRNGLIQALSLLHARFPGIRLIANRGFELLPRIHPYIEAVAAESVLRGWDPERKAYRLVPAEDRQWLEARFAEARAYGLTGIAIDYVPTHDREGARQTARSLLEKGLVPWVANGALDTLGIGRVEVQRRKVLVLYENPLKNDIAQTEIAQFLMMPLQHLGLQVEVRNLEPAALGLQVMADRYAGVVVWTRSVVPELQRPLLAFYRHLIEKKVPLVFLNSFGVPLDRQLASLFGLAPTGYDALMGSAPRMKTAMVGFERPVMADATVGFKALAPHQAQLRFEDAKGRSAEPVAITSWGGYAMAPYVIAQLGFQDQYRWLINPLEFLSQALRLPDMPVPDLTTEVGRRMAFVHIDGDGFASRAEIPGAPFAAQVMLERYIARSHLPHTVSIIEAEVAGHGLFKALSPALESIARSIFALPQVEAASHSFSHPYRWRELASSAEGVLEGASLKIPDYRFNLDREIVGSSQYITQRLLPAGKRSNVFLWTGDCIPPASALAVAANAGLLAMNGGETIITKSNPSWTAISGVSLKRDGWLQVLAPVQSEMLYTNLWTGPFYGFRRVIETFELTGAPHRFKPINLYYHTYAASKPGSIQALDEIYAWIATQTVNPVEASRFIAKVHDFESVTVAVSMDAQRPWIRLRGQGELRSWRWRSAAVAQIDWAQSDGLTGAALQSPWSSDLASRPVHLHGVGPQAVIALRAPSVSSSEPAMQPPLLVQANATVTHWERHSTGLAMTLQGRGSIEFALAHSQACSVQASGLKPDSSFARSDEGQFFTPSQRFVIPAPHAHAQPWQALVSVAC
jgi:hypothetical protein